MLIREGIYTWEITFKKVKTSTSQKYKVISSTKAHQIKVKLTTKVLVMDTYWCLSFFWIIPNVIITLCNVFVTLIEDYGNISFTSEEDDVTM